MITTTQKLDMDSYYEKKNNGVFGILEIPSIKLKNPIYSLKEPQNNVDKNIELLEETITKQKGTSILVLAGHSGNGFHAYFKNLEYLSEQESIYFFYQEELYEYQYFEKEEVLKNGTVYLKSYPFSFLAMITCSKTNDKIQEVYYAKLVKKSNFLQENS